MKLMVWCWVPIRVKPGTREMPSERNKAKPVWGLESDSPGVQCWLVRLVATWPGAGDNLGNSCSDSEMCSYFWGSVKVNSKSGGFSVWGRMSPIFLCGQSKTLSPLTWVQHSFQLSRRRDDSSQLKVHSKSLGKANFRVQWAAPTFSTTTLTSGFIHLVNWYILRPSLC